MAEVNYINEKLEFYPMHKSAIAPKKSHPTDVGWNVYIVNRTDNRVEDTFGEVNKFGTGLQLSPAKGYAVMVYGKDSLSSAGYQLATGVSVIDPSYTGELIIPLIKFKNSDDIDLPYKAVQIVLTPVSYAHASQRSVPREIPEKGDDFDSAGYFVKEVKKEKKKKKTKATPSTSKTSNHMF